MAQDQKATDVVIETVGTEVKEDTTPKEDTPVMEKETKTETKTDKAPGAIKKTGSWIASIASRAWAFCKRHLTGTGGAILSGSIAVGGFMGTYVGLGAVGAAMGAGAPMFIPVTTLAVGVIALMGGGAWLYSAIKALAIADGGLIERTKKFAAKLG